MVKSPPTWMPDFCSLPRLLAVIVISQMVVLIIGIAPVRAAEWSFSEFSSAGALSLWIALASASVLCKAGPAIGRLPQWLGWPLALSIPGISAALVAWALSQIDQTLGDDFILSSNNYTQFIWSITALTTVIGALTLRYFFVSDRWQQQVNAVAKAQMDALQARIRPHFLFNSMNSIAALVRRDPQTAEQAVEDLAELFRAALGAGQSEANLDEEIHLAERYLAIEQLRLGERLVVDWKLHDDLPRQLKLPRLILQPMVENAVLHGVSQIDEGGTIEIQIYPMAKTLKVLVRNPAPKQRQPSRHNGHAQDSILQRLRFHFGERATLKKHQTEGIYTCELELPLP